MITESRLQRDFSHNHIQEITNKPAFDKTGTVTQ